MPHLPADVRCPRCGFRQTLDAAALGVEAIGGPSGEYPKTGYYRCGHLRGLMGEELDRWEREPLRFR